MTLRKFLIPLTLITSLYMPTAMAVDTREIIYLSEDEKDALLSEMRGFLAGSQLILESALIDEMDLIEQTAREMGIKSFKNNPKSFMSKLPNGWVSLGPNIHLGFESIANEASGMADSTVILKQLAKLQRSCVGCHQMYQIKTDPKLQ